MLEKYARYDEKRQLIVYGGEMRLNGKNVRPSLLIRLGAPYFQVLRDGLLLYGKTTAICKRRYYVWKICKI